MGLQKKRKLVSNIYIYLILMFSFSLFSRQFKRHCSMIFARKDLKTNKKKDKKRGKIVGPFSELEQVPVVRYNGLA